MAVLNSNIVAQNNPPVKQWQWSGPSTWPSTLGYDDWLLDVLPTSDGGYVGVGFTYVSANNTAGYAVNPVAIKVNAYGEKLWERVCSGYVPENNGKFNRAIELPNSKYAISGWKVDPSNKNSVFFVVIDQFGNVVGNNQYFYGESNLPNFSTNYPLREATGQNASLVPIKNAGVITGIMIGAKFKMVMCQHNWGNARN
nr:hypothetical protein [Bacteroidota bacterium]